MKARVVADLFYKQLSSIFSLVRLYMVIIFMVNTVFLLLIFLKECYYYCYY